jgi:ubiquinone/menaquinone biosynthesis C-methylase UbiE
MSNNWWQEHMNDPKWIDIFKNDWVKDATAPSRVEFKKELIKMKDIDTVLECGCAYSVDSEWIREIGKNYFAIDFTPLFVEDCQKRGLDVVLGNIENIPYEDDSFDLVYCRHVLEHLSYYEKAISEMLRVAKKKVGVIFFLPLDKEEHIIFNEEMKLHHNVYGLEKFIAFVKGLGVKNFRYEVNVNLGKESILFLEK